MGKPVSSALSAPTVDIVIPVYKDLNITRRCIESVLTASYKTKYCLIVINDASPEPEVSQYLTTLAATNTIILIENKENKGFVQSVNIGMQQHLQRDVILLNSDTIVANDWLDRLYQCAHKEATIATVTPFSNNATICSYPKTCEENKLPAEYSLVELDALFASNNSGEYIDIPTAVGFCMFIKRDCLHQIGYFDAQRFGKGYGEENDFCLRAIKKGWRNVIACDVFVYHEGSVSFGETKRELIQNAQKILQKRYPAYPLSVQKFIAKDPLLSFRQRVDVSRLQNSKRPTSLFMVHGGEGGVLKHVKDLIHHFDSQLNCLVLLPEDDFRIKLYWANEPETFSVFFPLKNPSLLIKLLKTLGIDRIHVHHTLGWQTTAHEVLNNLALPYDITIHDYYLFCPQISVTTKQGAFCGLPEVSVCQKCVDARWSSRGINIIEWRKNHQLLLENAQRVFVPTQSVLQIMEKYFKQVNYIVTAHLEKETLDSNLPYIRACADAKPLKVLILGSLSQIKGADILLQCADLAKKNRQPIEFHLLGHPYRKFPKNSHLVIHGRYADSELEALINTIDPHIAWFPALCPETYSYTLSACLKVALPIVSSDLGAQAERVKGRKLSFVKPWQTSPGDWNQFFLEYKEKGEEVSSGHLTDIKTFNQHFSYSTDYLVSMRKFNALNSEDSNQLLNEITRIKVRSLKRSIKIFKRKTYFFMLLCYSKLGFEYLLPRDKLEFMKELFQKSLLSRD